MPVARSIGKVYEFGPFSLDPSGRCLSTGRSIGRSIGSDLVALTPKAIDILVLLVENAGKTVSKSEILERVWSGTYVEEGNISQHIFVIRKALAPGFDGTGPIATVSRVGYRFTAEVRIRDANAPAIAAAETASPETTSLEAASPETTSATIVSNANAQSVSANLRWRRPAMVLAAMVVVAILAFVVRLRFTGGESPFHARRSVAVLPFGNLSGHPDADWYSTAIAETLAAELNAGGNLRMLSGETVVRSVRDLVIDGGDLTADQIQDLRRSLNCDLVVTGSYLEIDGRLRLNARVVEAGSGQLVSVFAASDQRENLLDLVARAGADMRNRLGVAPVSGAGEAAVRTAISPNPAAAHAYFEGLKAFYLRDMRTARTALERAVVADPSFALAHSALAGTLKSLGHDREAVQHAKTAFENSSYLGREDRLGIEARYNQVSGKWARSVEIWHALWDAYPDNWEYGFNTGYAQYSLNDSKNLLLTVERLRGASEPVRVDPRIDILESDAHILNGGFAEGKAAAARAFATALRWKSPTLQAAALLPKAISESGVGDLQASLEDYESARTLLVKLGDRAGAADVSRLRGLALNRLGRAREAEPELREALETARDIGYDRLADRVLAVLGGIYTRLGRLREAGEALSEAASLSASIPDLMGAIEVNRDFGVLRRVSGDFKSAALASKAAIDAAQKAGARNYVALATIDLARLEASEGSLDDARRDIATEVAAIRQFDHSEGLANSLYNSAYIGEIKGDFIGASSSIRESCELWDRTRQAPSMAMCRIMQARIFADQSQTREAASALDRALSKPLQPMELRGDDWASAAALKLELGDSAGAESLLRQGLSARKERGYIAEQDLPLDIVSAAMNAAHGNRDHGIDALRSLRAQAQKVGLKTVAYQAWLEEERVNRPGTYPEFQAAAERAGFKWFAQGAPANAVK